MQKIFLYFIISLVLISLVVLFIGGALYGILLLVILGNILLNNWWILVLIGLGLFYAYRQESLENTGKIG